MVRTDQAKGTTRPRAKENKNKKRPSSNIRKLRLEYKKNESKQKVKKCSPLALPFFLFHQIIWFDNIPRASGFLPSFVCWPYDYGCLQSRKIRIKQKFHAPKTQREENEKKNNVKKQNRLIDVASINHGHFGVDPDEKTVLLPRVSSSSLPSMSIIIMKSLKGQVCYGASFITISWLEKEKRARKQSVVVDNVFFFLPLLIVSMVDFYLERIIIKCETEKKNERMEALGNFGPPLQKE